MHQTWRKIWEKNPNVVHRNDKFIVPQDHMPQLMKHELLPV
ncbi:hypothetical protein J2T11_000032 [Paenarthrobacter nicotinovorans]|nr:hypothetical protein [Paenarthrobacter nicotinovorans]MDP9933708.1 hypothetical protein [Paenarthrobacter nicotinovorans]